MQYERLISLNSSSSFFLFGPRMVGKTSLLKSRPFVRYIDLLDKNIELKFRINPESFWEEVSTLPKASVIIIDEIQKLPELLDYVQKAIDEHNHRFLLSGSSARKLKRSGANLLGGRAIEKHLFALSYLEIGDLFAINDALTYGSLPKITTLISQGNVDDAKDILESYCTLYLKEEVQAEAIVRNMSSFTRFLNVAAQSHGHIIEFANIERSAKVPASTVKEYFSILEDTLIGSFLWPWDSSERKKARPKFYFFDPGIVRALQNRLNDPPTGQELGLLFEGWFVYEVKKLNHYFKKRLHLSSWRYKDYELDLMITNANHEGIAIEIKSGNITDFPPTFLGHFRKQFPKVELIVASLKDTEARKLQSGIVVYPWKQALEKVKDWA